VSARIAARSAEDNCLKTLLQPPGRMFHANNSTFRR